LAQAGLDPAGFAHLLATPAHVAGAALRGLPPWMRDLGVEAPGGEPAAPGGEPPSAPSPDLDPLLAPVRPWIDRARARLRQGLAWFAAAAGASSARGAEPLFAAAETEALLAASLPARLLPVVARTLVLELHVARHLDLLSGETAAERFQSFLARLGRRDVAAALLGEYPVLAREVMRELAQWVDTGLELMERLAADAPLLLSHFFAGRHPGLLSGIDGGAGDRHRGGRSVRVLTFASGARLVYKPRPLAAEQRFQELLAWLGDTGDGSPRTVAVLDRGSHGWMEFVTAQGCRDPAEVAAFYRRLGGLLALLYALEATDCHCENLIAAGGHPVLVDLETLFQPRLPLQPLAAPDKRLVGRLLNDSVPRIGLLPFLVGAGDGFAGVDISGLAAVAGQLSPQPVLALARGGTDEMHVVRERLPLPGGANVPFLAGEDGRGRQEAEAAEHGEELAAGFAAVYRRLIERRAELLAPQGPLARCRGVPVRAVLRPTQIYARLLGESYHPDVLRDALDRDLLFDRLWLGAEEQPELALVAAAEHRDLLAGDVPVFTVTPGSPDLVDSRGGRLAGFFPEPAMAAVERRLAGMGEVDLDRQLGLLRLSLATRRLGSDPALWTGYPRVAAGRPLPRRELRERLLAAARNAGDWFAATAVRDARHVSWVALEFSDKRWSLAPVPRDLYLGTPGIALFLGCLHTVTGDARAADLARAALATLRESMEREAADVAGRPAGRPAKPPEPPYIGLMQGPGGILYVWAHLAALWRDSGLLAEAAPAIELIDARLARDRELDVVAGAAGAIAGLLAAHRAGAGPRALAVAVRCGEHLLARAEERGAGICWLTRLASERSQTGFAHGVTGIALALVALGAAAGDRRFTDAGLAAFAWEREVFWPELARWLGGGTAAAAAHGDSVAMSWCYGAPGIGIARLAALRHLEAAPSGPAMAAAGAALTAEVAEAVRLTVEHGFGQNHCLCHGDLGNLDFLASAERQLGGDAALGRQVWRRTQQVLASIGRDGWCCGTRAAVESPGLMNGIAGIGYGLLRLAEPGRVPSVLALAPPSV
jgi:type 2 lantibiotic biosynthesis protein LanM